MVAILIILVLLAGPTYGHDAPSGWPYPQACCDQNDCKVLDADRVKETASGFSIDDGRFLVSFATARLSPDGLYHWCVIPTTGGGIRGTSGGLCFWAPPRGM